MEILITSLINNVHPFTKLHTKHFERLNKQILLSEKSVGILSEAVFNSTTKFILDLQFGQQFVKNYIAFQKELTPANKQKGISFVKGKITKSNSNQLTGRLKLLEVIDKITENKIKISSISKELYQKLTELIKYKYDPETFLAVYDRLTPFDKIYLMDELKKYINPCYHDFYNAFIPLNIQHELENKKLLVLCQFAEFSCDDCEKEHKFCINVKVPMSNDVHFTESNDVHFTGANYPNSPGANYPNSPGVKPQNLPVTDSLLSRFRSRVVYFYKSSELLEKGLAKQPFTVHVFLSQHNKLLDFHKPGKIIGATETNSAYCHPTTSFVKIVLYRQEEICKIALHEMLHGVEIEGSYKNRKFKNLIQQIVNFDHYCRESHIQCTKISSYNEDHITNISEGYVDFCADIINILLYSAEIIVERGLNQKNLFNVFNEILFIETNFALFQVAKILVYFDFADYRSLFVANPSTLVSEFIGEKIAIDSTTSNKTKVIRQSTNVFSYFVLRAVLLFSFKDVLITLEKMQSIFERSSKRFPAGDLLNFFALYNNVKLEEIHRLMAKNLFNKSIETIVNEYMRLIRNGRVAESLLTSMRRSMIELN